MSIFVKYLHVLFRMDDCTETPLQCVLHIIGDDKYDSDALVPFTEQTWRTTAGIAQARELHQRRSKYHVICQSINFEDEPLPHYGFHGGCYSKFTAYQVQTKAKKAPSDKDITIETRSMVENHQWQLYRTLECWRKSVFLQGFKP